MRQQSFSGIDITKFIMAILVLMLHTNPFLDISKTMEWVSRSCLTVIAVPFFFICNGYFAFESDKTTNRSVKKLLLLYIIWSIVYCPFSLMKLSGNSSPIAAYVVSFFIYGSYDTIWYLLASATGLLFVWLLKKWKGIRFAVLISLLFHVIALLGTSYAGLVENTRIWYFYDQYYSFFQTFKNGLFFASIYVALGAWIREELYDKIRIRLSENKSVVLTCLLFIGIVIETAGCKYFKLDTLGVDMKIMLIPFSLILFITVLDCNCGITEEKSILLRKLSTMIFLTQRLFLTGYELLGIQIHSFLWFILIAGSSILLSLGIIMLSKKVKIIRKLY